MYNIIYRINLVRSYFPTTSFANENGRSFRHVLEEPLLWKEENYGSGESYSNGFRYELL